MESLKQQIGGTHYQNLKIQPIEFIHENKLGFIEGNIVKYASRHDKKNGAEDVAKIIHYAKMLLQLQYNYNDEALERVWHG